MRKQQGFTLIELVTVIVILGILAAFAVPRFINLTSEAKTASINGLAGSVKAASALAHSLAIVQGKTADSGDSVEMDGQDVTLAYGYPTADADGIGKALDYDGYTAADNNGDYVFWLEGDYTGAATAATNCGVSYTAATSKTGANSTSSVESTTSDCS